MEPFDVLFDASGAGDQLTGELSRLYGGGLGFRRPSLYANFVASADGVVAIEGVPSAGSLISGRNEADRFLMGLLRAFADAVLIGAGTMRDTPGHLWTPGHVYPAATSDFAQLRSRLGLGVEPRLAVVTASGNVDAAHPAISHGASILTTPKGERALPRLPPSCDVVAIGDGDSLDLASVVEHLGAQGHQVVLSEGGPHVIGQLLEKELLGELFLTISPVVAGRVRGRERLGLVEGAEFLPKDGRWAELTSARRHRDHLFLRYRFQQVDAPSIRGGDAA